MNFNPKGRQVSGSLAELMARVASLNIVRDLLTSELAAIGAGDSSSGALYDNGTALIVDMQQGEYYSEHTQDSGWVRIFLVMPS